MARRVGRRPIGEVLVLFKRHWSSSRAVVLIALCAHGLAAQATLPTRLADSTFWRLFTTFSEPGGFFQSDNFVSNEWELQYEIPAVRARVPAMDAYVGVGPEQNLTYIVALRPRIAFVVDIRRQNAIQHLLYKALTELSSDRAEFLSRLLSRPRPDGLDSTSTPLELVGAFQVAGKDSALHERNVDAVLSHLVERRRFALSPADSATLRTVYGAFFDYGSDITYGHRADPTTLTGSLTGLSQSYGVRISTMTIRGQDSSTQIVTRVDTTSLLSGGTLQRAISYRMPSFADMMVADDGHGINHGWLATEANFRVLKDYHDRNMIVPLVGNFAGPTALRSVGEYLRRHDAKMSVFYLSNVEQYLFQIGDQWKQFYENVATMPFDSTSTFIRSVTNPRYLQPRHPRSRMAQMSASIEALVRAYQSGRVAGYYDVLMLLR
jgi:hypothetical protein